ncbi:tyrosine-type recombinase/integrase [Microbacterium phosphatis]|uniref:tyrosine-type recombinase/integrase n=1 Tax=Microbacterium phosphatis TaxID=3140248 RepID=UPI003140247D
MARPRKAPGELGTVTIDKRGNQFRARAKIRDGRGDLIHISVLGDTPEQARRAAEAKARQIWSRLFVEVTPATTVAQLVQMWLASPRVRSRRPSTQQQYEINARTILLDRIGAVHVKALTPQFVALFIYQLNEERGSAYAARAKRTLGPVLNVAVKQGIIAHNPVRGLDRLEHGEREYLALTAEQVAPVLRLMSEWRGLNPDRRGGVRANWQLLLDSALISLGSSARPGEVLALRREDMRFKDGRMQLRLAGTVTQTKAAGNSRQDSPKKARQKRWITVPEFTAAVVRRRVANYRENPDGLLLSTKNGTPYAVNKLELTYREFRRHAADELRALGIDRLDLFTPKVFRKTAATMVQEGADIDLARRFLGHADERTTKDHYLPPEEVVPERTARILDAALGSQIDIAALMGDNR